MLCISSAFVCMCAFVRSHAAKLCEICIVGVASAAAWGAVECFCDVGICHSLKPSRPSDPPSEPSPPPRPATCSFNFNFNFNWKWRPPRLWIVVVAKIQSRSPFASCQRLAQDGRSGRAEQDAMCKLRCARKRKQCAMKMIAMAKMMISSLAACEEGKSLSAAFVENDRSPDATCPALNGPALLARLS